MGKCWGTAPGFLQKQLALWLAETGAVIRLVRSLLAAGSDRSINEPACRSKGG